MKSIRIPFKQDVYQTPLYCRISWEGTQSRSPKPIALIYHTGGLIVGSSEVIPKPQIEYLTSKGFVVVAPNYRLAPQATAATSVQDAEEAFDWSTTTLPSLLLSQHDVALDPSRVVTMGHSSGGTLALHVASVRPVKATTAFYPTLYVSDPTTSAHFPTSAPPFNSFPDFEPSSEDWLAIAPPNVQVSEASLAPPGSVPSPRNRWQAMIIKHGKWMNAVCPEGDHAVMDPLAHVKTRTWPATMIVQGDADLVPGSGIELARRAEKDLRDAGVEVSLDVVPFDHMFDFPPMVGTTDKGPKWEAVVRGMEWLCSRG